MEKIKKGVVVDSNVIFSALISRRSTNREILQRPLLFLSPDYALREIEAHMPLKSRSASNATSQKGKWGSPLIRSCPTLSLSLKNLTGPT